MVIVTVYASDQALLNLLVQRSTTFLGQGPQGTVFSALEGRGKKL